LLSLIAIIAPLGYIRQVMKLLPMLRI
jgi:hypothetical protein